jgi:transposase
MELYCGIDLHSSNSFVSVIDGGLEGVCDRRLSNDLGRVVGFLEPYREDLVSVAVESTYNWYWLVDGLKDAGYDVRLVNTTKAAKYDDMKYTDDKHDARWIARLLALGILPEGYITPPQERGVRDLLRRRSYFVRKKTAHLASVRTYFERSIGHRLDPADISQWTTDEVRVLMKDPFVADSIACVLPVIRVLTLQIKEIEKRVLAVGKLRNEFRLLKTAPGIGDILAMTIMWETQDINRFPRVGNYASYCRCVKTEHLTNHKRKGAGNRKNGNAYLSWAYSEAAHHAIRYEPLAKRYYDRKRARSHVMIARRALAHKIARACYHVLRNQVPFDPNRAFC